MTSNTDNPEVLDSVPLPSAAERRHREVMSARVMLVAIDIVPAGDALRMETARDLRREVRRTYPELVQAAPDSCSAGLAINGAIIYGSTFRYRLCTKPVILARLGLEASLRRAAYQTVSPDNP
jgi:hypothetical protein